MNSSFSVTRSRLLVLATAAVVALVILCWPDVAWVHGVSNRDAAFVRSVTGPVPAPFMYLGAKHMVTGYDHLLFLVGYDFHGEPDGTPARYSESYGKGEGASASGVFLAPKPGIHGGSGRTPGQRASR